MGSFKDRPTVNLLDCQHLIDTKHLCKNYLTSLMLHIHVPFMLLFENYGTDDSNLLVETTDL